MDYIGYEMLQIDMQEGILTVRLNRPDNGNAINPQMNREFERIWLDIDSDPSVDAVVLTGAGDKFSVGGDANTLHAGTDYHPLTKNGFRRARRAISNMLQVEPPIIAAINGDAVGLGANLALLCDVSFAVKSARIGDPHVRMGVVAGDSGCVIWPLLCGPNLAKEYLMTGDLMTAEKAERIGLVNHVVEEGKAYEEAVAFAKRLQRGTKLAIRWNKHSVNKLVQQQYNLVMDTSLALEQLTLMSEDFKEATGAFLQKRKPAFKGK
jgi:enoyl-CoA hydratase